MNYELLVKRKVKMKNKRMTNTHMDREIAVIPAFRDHISFFPKELLIARKPNSENISNAWPRNSGNLRWAVFIVHLI